MIDLKEKITTNRLTLKLLRVADNDFVYRLVNSEGWLQFIGDRNVSSPDDAVKYIDKLLHTDNLFYWVVRLKDSKRPIGIVSFLRRSYLENFDLGFALLPEFNGNGYAFEAANALLTTVTQYPPYQKVLATTLPSNLNSIKVLTKLGFSFAKEMEINNQTLLIYSNTMSATTRTVA